jgi:hypothetical protein
MTTDEFLMRALPAEARWAQWAANDALELERNGLSLAAIEHKLFDGIPPDKSSAVLVGRMRSLTFERAQIGTKALVVAMTAGMERGIRRAHETLAVKRAQAESFGRNRVADALRAAGWQQGDIDDASTD